MTDTPKRLRRIVRLVRRARRVQEIVRRVRELRGPTHTPPQAPQASGINDYPRGEITGHAHEPAPLVSHWIDAREINDSNGSTNACRIVDPRVSAAVRHASRPFPQTQAGHGPEALEQALGCAGEAP